MTWVRMSIEKMKMPATTEGVPLIAVTTVLTVREPKPRTSFR